jgi:hypothetical protein
MRFIGVSARLNLSETHASSYSPSSFDMLFIASRQWPQSPRATIPIPHTIVSAHGWHGSEALFIESVKDECSIDGVNHF